MAAVGAQPEARDSRRGLPLSATKLPFDMAPLYGNDAPTAAIRQNATKRLEATRCRHLAGAFYRTLAGSLLPIEVGFYYVSGKLTWITDAAAALR